MSHTDNVSTGILPAFKLHDINNTWIFYRADLSRYGHSIMLQKFMFRKMSFISFVFTCFVVLAIQSSWASDEAKSKSCRFLGGQFSQVEFAKVDERITYKLTSQNEKWANEPFGWHATGILKCEDCSEQGTAIGMYRFHPNLSSFMRKDRVHAWPSNSKERIEQANETFGYPMIPVSGKNLVPLSYRDDIEHQNLVGYAVLFRVDLDEDRRLLNANLAFQDLHLLILSLTDDCLRFETTIQIHGPPSAGIGIVDTILEDISISHDSEPLDQKTQERVAKRDQDQVQRRQSEDELIKLMPIRK